MHCATEVWCLPPGCLRDVAISRIRSRGLQILKDSASVTSLQIIPSLAQIIGRTVFPLEPREPSIHYKLGKQGKKLLYHKDSYTPVIVTTESMTTFCFCCDMELSSRNSKPGTAPVIHR